MGQGTISQGFPGAKNYDGSDHEANKHIDHELNTEHDHLMHHHGPMQDSGYQPASRGNEILR